MYLPNWLEAKCKYITANVNKSAVLLGIAEWEAETCIKFVETSDTTGPRILFIKATGCYSSVGQIPSPTGQHLSLDDNCYKVKFVFKISFMSGLLLEKK